MMSDRSPSRFVHPEIASIIRKRDEVHHFLYSNYNPLRALEGMVGLIYEIKREDRDEELIDKILKNINYLTQMRSRTARETEGLKMKQIFWGYLEQVNTILMTKGYLSNEFYTGFFDTAEGRKSGR